MVVVDRNLAHGARKSHRQLSGRIYVAKQNISDRIPRLRPAHPRLKNRGHVVNDPANGQRPSVNQHDDRGFACRVNRLHQFELATRKIE